MSEFHIDSATTTVPNSERRGPVTMGLLWITMVTAFPSLLIGFEWYKMGISWSQVFVCAAVSCIFLLLYTVPIAQLSAITGKGYGMLNNYLFGRQASMMINCALIMVFTSFYGLAALLLAETLTTLFHLSVPIAPFAALLALSMALNNFFGFRGIANFARFLAAPVIITWVCYTFFKAAPACSTSVFTQVGTQSWALALTTISSFIVGFAVWGNEADYWRYGQPRLRFAMLPLAVALCTGELIFPLTGWMVAKLTGITDFAAATTFMNSYSFGGVAAIGALVVSASYFAANDSNLFGSAGALEIMFGLKHKVAVAVLAVLGMFTAYTLSICGSAKALESIASLNSVLLPVPSVLMVCEWWLSTRHGRAPFSLGGNSRAAVVAMLCGVGLGVITSGVLPGSERLHVGIGFLQAWGLALAIYIPLRLLEYKQVRATITLFSSQALEPAEIPVRH